MRLVPTDGSADQRSVDRSLRLAEDAAAFASPNPTVGCVLATGDQILGEGAHRYEARDHAEIVALKAAAAAGHDVRGATAYVTLEPCAHHGRTGPCADALIAAGIGRCVVATVDPNPLVRGQGLARLRAAGVVVDLLDPDSLPGQRTRRLNDAFAFSIQHGRPFITLKAALSIDAKIAPPPQQRTPGEPFWLTGQAARNDVAGLRHASDALLSGIGTVLADDPRLTDRTALPRRRPLLRVILDSQLRIPLDSRLVQEAQDDLLLVCDTTADQTRVEELKRFALEVVPIEALRRPGSLPEVVKKLGNRHVRSLLIEAGSTLNGAFLHAGLVDRAVLYYADRELGENAVPFAANYPSPYLLQQRLTSVTEATFPNGGTEDVRITGYLRDPWIGVSTGV